MSRDNPTLPPREVTLAEVHATQVRLAEQVATVLSIVRTLAIEVSAMHEALRPENLKRLVRASQADIWPE